ncbi:MAG: hypothetical protein IKJ35_02945 [Clostridia bacterium]|nr:hypothetical protein [Clostridia bacterium]
MKFHRRFLFPLLLALTIFLATIGVSAKETAPATDQMPEEFFTLLESVPEDIAELLPEELFSSDRTQVGDAVVQMSDFGYLMQVLLSLIGANLTECLGLLASVCGLLILSSVCGTLRTSFRNEGVGQAFSFCSTLVILLSFFSQSYRCLESVTDYFAKLCGFSSASVPIMGVLYAMGGNVSTAVAASSGLSVFMAVLEQAVGKTVLPFCGICMALALISALNPALRTGTLLSTLKKNYTTALTFLMMLLLAMLAAQTTLAARSDTLAMKSVKFAAGNLIPVVGGSVSELLRTVSAGVGFLRGTVGICGVLLLILMLMPTLVKLLLFRLTWQLSASLADLLGCDLEKKLLDEFASLLGYLVAAVSICSSVLVLSLTLLTHCASAIG